MDVNLTNAIENMRLVYELMCIGVSFLFDTSIFYYFI